MHLYSAPESRRGIVVVVTVVLLLLVVVVAVVGNGGWWYGVCSTSVINYDEYALWKVNDAIQDVQASSMLVKLN